jgi:predicted dehydrogenase
MRPIRVIVLDPGHFHAALSLRESHPCLEDDVDVYAPEGPGLEAFCAMVETFNRREVNPTRWRVHRHVSTQPLESLLEERRGGLVILAGRNHAKAESIERLNAAGYLIFADKPWVVDGRALPFLERALGREGPPTTDIMTSRFEPTSLLLQACMAEPAVFGQPRAEDGLPAVTLESVHHLLKIVNGSVLRRPPWYFDIGIQGDGMVDVTTHLVDLAHWLLFPGQALSWPGDFALEGARRWDTPVSGESFARITGLGQFPEELRPRIRDGVLPYACNGEIRYRARGIGVHVKVAWNLEQSPGVGDTHRTLVRGTVADLVVRQLPERGYRTEYVVVPRDDYADFGAGLAAALRRRLPGWSGLGVQRQGEEYLVHIPPVALTTHEQHFCAARDTFLDEIERGAERPEHRGNTLTKYRLLVAARELALLHE